MFLDDLGINLKPARELGMTTIKVTDPDTALAELESVFGARSSLKGSRNRRAPRYARRAESLARAEGPERPR